MYSSGMETTSIRPSVIRSKMTIIIMCLGVIVGCFLTGCASILQIPSRDGER